MVESIASSNYGEHETRPRSSFHRRDTLPRANGRQRQTQPFEGGDLKTCLRRSDSTITELPLTPPTRPKMRVTVVHERQQT
jgi:hypothetical protein